MSRIPFAEWAPQRALFVGFPSDPELWEDDLAPAQAEVAAMARQLSETVTVRLLASGADAARTARGLVPAAVLVDDIAFGDIWLRDTGPVFTGAGSAVRFRFNGWGGKYDLPGDDTVGAEMAGLMSAAVEPFDFVLEGGAIEYDGGGLVLTTEQCLLNPNRNPGWTRAAAEAALGKAIGARRLVWLGDGLLNDHTDGHVDNLARFVGEGRLAIPVAAGSDDPNAAIYADARARTAAFGGIEIVDLPSPGRVDVDGELVAASYMNFYIGNSVVVVPTYGVPNDAAAIDALAALFPGRRAVGVPARGIIAGGGSFHCSSQQLPS